MLGLGQGDVFLPRIDFEHPPVVGLADETEQTGQAFDYVAIRRHAANQGQAVAAQVLEHGQHTGLNVAMCHLGNCAQKVTVS